MHTTSRTRDLPTTTSSEAPSVRRAALDGAGHQLGVPAPSRDERRSPRRPVLIGVVSAVAVATALTLIGVVRTGGPGAVEADVSRGPNADLPVDWTLTDVSPARPATDVARGPNADLPPDWISRNTAATARAATNKRGPNADLPVDATVNVTTDRAQRWNGLARPSSDQPRSRSESESG